MISWEEAKYRAKRARPDLNEQDRKIIARSIYMKENLIISSPIISLVALAMSVIALCN